MAPTVAACLEALAAIDDRSVLFLVADALQRYLADEERQIGEIHATVAEADALNAALGGQENLEGWAEQIRSHPDVPRSDGQPRGDRARAV